MADIHPDPHANSPIGDTPRRKPDHGSTTGAPRWVKVFVIIVIILVVLFVILHLTGNGFGNHMHMSINIPISTHGGLPL
ncbi:hypothetical protein [Ktedonospora formicarum]|uniref:Uncharacterized protein n=1 Tax=Ktedonospora formicarum TaxID=2778364 RepID=A0A8J3IB39_9CHLR|nr:hypothetical protein [Ktedonospora formicarum]GHO48814.1 hypothetical protein KSX_69770 [Ktedonospora formicarum]